MTQIHANMRRPVLIDGRNIYEAPEMNRIGFIYRGMGRGTSPAPTILPAGDTSGDPEEAQQPTLGLEATK